MNQIVFIQNNNKNKKHILKYSILLFLSILVLIILLFYIIIYIYSLKRTEKLSHRISESFNISTLYNNSTNYSTSNDLSNKNDFFVIGIVEIDSISLHYPILSKSNEEHLKISPCRFAGPMPNEVGNLCIAGHNYIDNSFFAKIKKLVIGDEIKIYDLYGNLEYYIIISITSHPKDDYSIVSQNTNGEVLLTLMTCNSVNDTRFVVKAKKKK